MQTNIEVSSDLCAECEGACCYIFLHRNRNWMNEWFSETLENWEETFKDALKKYKPVYDIKVWYDKDIAEIEKKLYKKGIDIHACPFLGKCGCILPREERPTTCTHYWCGGERVRRTCAGCKGKFKERDVFPMSVYSNSEWLCKMCIKNRKETLTREEIIQISIEGWPTIEEELWGKTPRL